jgi:type IV pilus assembly protein PilV
MLVRATPSPRRTVEAVRGFTLIEVLISILVFSLAILGAVGMQARILQASTQNADRSRASFLANEMVSWMWGQQTTTVDAATLANWNARVGTPTVDGLPGGIGSVATDPTTKVATVTIKWRPTAMAASATPNQFVTTVLIP